MKILPLFIALLAPLWALPTVTWGIAVGPTISTTSGSTAATVASGNAEELDDNGMLISIAGVTGYKRITAISGTSITLDSTADATVTGAAVKVIADGLDHAAMRVWFTTSESTCSALWFDTSTHASGPSYQYRSYEGGCGTTHANTLVGLAPATTYYIRANLKAATGTDNSGACYDDTCSSELVITTLADTHDADGRPPMPTPPEAVASWVTDDVDTSGYEVIPVPGFADGAITCTTVSGNANMTCSGTTGMAVHQWVMIAGAKCPGHGWYTGIFVGYQTPPWCHITGISGATVTLEYAPDASLSNAAVSWGLYTVWDAMQNRSKRYGTVFEWAQGYKAQWWSTNVADGDNALRLPGLPVDGAASSIDDPTHKWIIFRTASSPGKLPPRGTRTGPEYSSILGGIVSQGFASALASITNAANPTHHFRIENLELTIPAADPNAADPGVGGSLIDFTFGEGIKIPQYIAFDRLYMHTPDANTRLMKCIILAGIHVSITGNYCDADFWRPNVYTMGEATITNGGANVSFPGGSYKRNAASSTWTVGTVTLGRSGTASKDVRGVLYIDGAGTHLRYTSAGGITMTCDICVDTAAAAAATAENNNPAIPVTSKKILVVQVPNAGTSFECVQCLVADAEGNTTGTEAIYLAQGHHIGIKNNTLRTIGVAPIFLDMPTPGPPPRHIDIDRNDTILSDVNKMNSATSNGFWYQIRHSAVEFKRARNLRIRGYRVENGWARVNHGTAVVGSNTSSNSPYPYLSGMSDIIGEYNRFANVPETFGGGGHEVNTVSARPSARMYWGNNEVTGQNGFTRNENAAPAFYGKQGAFGGHDVISEHNVNYQARSNIPILWATGVGSWEEGLWYRNNAYHLSDSGSLWGVLVQTVAQTSGGATNLPKSPDVTTNSNQTANMNTQYMRLAASATNKYSIAANVLTCYVVEHYLADPTEMDSSECSTYQTNFGSLASSNFFPAGSTVALRNAAVKWASPAIGDLRLKPDSPYKSGGANHASDGLDIGPDYAQMWRKQGDVQSRGASAITSSGANIVFRAPDPGASCYVGYGTSSDPTAWTWTAANTDTTDLRSIALSSLTTHTVYHFRPACDGAKPVSTASFLTQ